MASTRQNSIASKISSSLPQADEASCKSGGRREVAGSKLRPPHFFWLKGSLDGSPPVVPTQRRLPDRITRMKPGSNVRRRSLLTFPSNRVRACPRPGWFGGRPSLRRAARPSSAPLMRSERSQRWGWVCGSGPTSPPGFTAPRPWRSCLASSPRPTILPAAGGSRASRRLGPAKRPPLCWLPAPPPFSP